MQSRIKLLSMTTTISWLLVAVILQISLQSHYSDNKYIVEAIKCYVCQSNIDPKCADPFDNLTLPITDCDAYPRADLVSKSEYDLVEEKSFFLSFGQQQPVIKPLRATMCRKIRQKVYGEWRTIRGCGYLGPPGNLTPESAGSSLENTDNCHIRHGTYDIFMESCACNSKDGCNAAVSISDIAFTSYSYLFLLLLNSLITMKLFFRSR